MWANKNDFSVLFFFSFSCYLTSKIVSQFAYFTKTDKNAAYLSQHAEKMTLICLNNFVVAENFAVENSHFNCLH